MQDFYTASTCELGDQGEAFWSSALLLGGGYLAGRGFAEAVRTPGFPVDAKRVDIRSCKEVHIDSGAIGLMGSGLNLDCGRRANQHVLCIFSLCYPRVQPRLEVGCWTAAAHRLRASSKPWVAQSCSGFSCSPLAFRLGASRIAFEVE